MFLAREATNLSFPELGNAFGNRDHTTVMSGRQRIANLANTNAGTRAHLDELRAALRPAAPAAEAGPAA